ncbi:hypothetical protein [Streptomyces sp. NBC_01361]|uniref:hypothetical protein n=1 Tax=Streptomyces sp. NBC_01361 TaxID=2903838 RepID=UPI002E333588|nr:hypothetical protein [Streptomyces sp. NBC_01361]
MPTEIGIVSGWPGAAWQIHVRIRTTMADSETRVITTASNLEADGKPVALQGGHMAIQPTGRTKDGPPMRRIAMASSIGTIIEFYDFAVFGTASALVFRQVFFPSLGDAQGLALALVSRDPDRVSLSCY